MCPSTVLAGVVSFQCGWDLRLLNAVWPNADTSSSASTAALAGRAQAHITLSMQMYRIQSFCRQFTLLDIRMRCSALQCMLFVC